MFKKLFFLLKHNPSYFFFLIIGLFRRVILIPTRSLYSPYPELITITVTNRCNFNCPGCSSNSPEYTRKNNRKLKEISLEDFKRIIDEVAGFKPFIYLNGGEPTLRPDLIEMIKYVKSKKLVCSFTSNGSLLTPKFLEELVKAKLDFLSVSIDGPKEFHDKIRGFNGAFERAVSSLNNLKSLKEKYKVDYPHVRLASIIYPEDLNNSRYIVNLAKELKVDELGFGLLMYYPEKIVGMQKNFVEKNKTGGEEPIGLQIGNKSKFSFNEKEYLEFLFYLKKSKIPVFLAYQGGQHKEYFDSRIFPSKKSVCLTPWNNLLIHPDGDLGVCQGFKFGSIYNRFAKTPCLSAGDEGKARFQASLKANSKAVESLPEKTLGFQPREAYKGSILSQWNNQGIINFRKKRAEGPFPACFRCNEGQKIMFDK